MNSDEAIAELLKKRHAEDDEEANIGNLSESQLAEMQQRANRSSRESTEGRTRASRSSRESADARSRRSRESVDGSRRASRESSDAPAPASLRASSTPGLGVAVETPVATSTANSQGHYDNNTCTGGTGSNRHRNRARLYHQQRSLPRRRLQQAHHRLRKVRKHHSLRSGHEMHLQRLRQDRHKPRGLRPMHNLASSTACDWQDSTSSLWSRCRLSRTR